MTAQIVCNIYLIWLVVCFVIAYYIDKKDNNLDLFITLVKGFTISIMIPPMIGSVLVIVYGLFLVLCTGLGI